MNLEVFVDELGAAGVVGVDAADAGGGEVDEVGAFGFEEGADGGLVEEVQLGAGAEDQFAVAVKAADESGAYEAVVAGYEGSVQNPPLYLTVGSAWVQPGFRWVQAPGMFVLNHGVVGFESLKKFFMVRRRT